MENWKYNDKFIQSYNLKIEDLEKLDSVLYKSVNQRKNFHINNNDIIIPRLFLSLVGIKDVENEYYDKLFDLKKNLEQYNDLFLFFENGIKISKDVGIKTKFENVWNRIKLFYDIEADKVVQLLYEHNLFPRIPNDALFKQLQENLEGIIDYYFEVSNDSISEEEFKNILLSVVEFINQYIPDLVKDYDYININPKILYYGNIRKNDAYILLYLSSLGMDIIYVNPYTDEELVKADPYLQFIQRIENNRKLFPKPFPISKNIGSIETPALIAQNDLREYLYNEETAMFQSQQLNQLTMSPVHLKTTYEELFIWLKEAPSMRPGFSKTNNSVIIPTIFSKVHGIKENEREFTKSIKKLLTNKDTFLYLPDNNKDVFVDWEIEEIIEKNINMFKNDDKWYYHLEKLQSSNLWGNFKKLSLHMQRNLMEKICLIISKDLIKIPPELLGNVPKELFILTCLLMLNLNEKWVEIIRNYDYGENAPSIISISRRKLSIYEILWFTLSNLLGINIVIFNTLSQADIEQYINIDLLDIHYLENSNSDYEYKKSLFGNEEIITLEGE